MHNCWAWLLLGLFLVWLILPSQEDFYPYNNYGRCDHGCLDRRYDCCADKPLWGPKVPWGLGPWNLGTRYVPSHEIRGMAEESYPWKMYAKTHPTN